MRALAPLDWGIVVAYLLVALAAGVLVARRAGRKAVFFAVLINGIVLGWVIRAMAKIGIAPHEDLRQRRARRSRPSPKSL